MISLEQIFVIHLMTTLVLTGVIWVVELVHYPSFYFVEKARFTQFEKFHSNRISFLVVPLMLTELATSVALLFSPMGAQWLLIANFVFLVLIWVFTFALSSRYHGVLMNGYDKKVVDLLVKTNSLRTFLWTLRSVVLIYILFDILN